MNTKLETVFQKRFSRKHDSLFFINIGLSGHAVREYGMKLCQSGTAPSRMPLNTLPEPKEGVF